MRLLGQALEPATTTRARCEYGEVPGGLPIGTDAYLVRGSSEGPVLYVGAGIHGDEVSSTAIVSALLRAVDASTLSGTLIVVPAQNPLAFADRHRLPLGLLLRSPMDQGPGNVFQSYPGDRRGNLSQRMAAVLFEELISRSDYMIDIHTPTTGGRYLPFAFTAPAEYGEVSERAGELAGHLGARVVLKAEGSNYTSPTTPHVAAAAHDVVGLGLELGQGGLYDPDDIRRGRDGLLNVLAAVGMVAERPVPVDPPPVFLAAIGKVRADVAGELHLDVQLGDTVSRGDALGAILDPLGTVRQVVEAPCSGIYMRETTFGFVGTGDLVCQIGERE